MDEKIDIDDLAPWFVAFLTLFGGALRILLLGQKGMGLDETFSVWLASHSVADVVQWVARIDQNPPLYYILLHYWTALAGTTPYYVRLLSALLGAATIPVVFLIGKRLSGAGVGLAAAAFLAVSPFNIYYSQETAMYTCLTLFAALAIYSLVRLLTDPRAAQPVGRQTWQYLRAPRTAAPVEPETKKTFSYAEESRNQKGWKGWLARRRQPSFQAIETDLAWVAFVVFSAATLLTHNAAVLFPLATNIFILGLIVFQRFNRSASPPALRAPSFLNWLLAQLGIFLLWSPWLPVFLKQAGAISQDFWLTRPGWENILQVITSFLNASLPGLAAQETFIWILYTVVLCLGLVYFRKKMAQFLFLAALFAVPFLAELIVSNWRPIFLDRTLIWTTVPLFLLLGAGIAQLRFRVLVFLMLGFLCANNLFSASDYFRFVQKEDWSTPAGYVARFAEKDDLVLFNDTLVQAPFDYYFREFEELYSIQVEKRGLPVDMADSSSVEPRMTANDVPRLLSLLNGHNRVWLVYSHNVYSDPAGLIPQALSAQMKCTQTRDFYGGQVRLYESAANGDGP